MNADLEHVNSTHSSSSSLKQIEKLILKLNQNAMDSLKEGKSDICKELLMKAESSLLSMDKNHEIMSKSGDAVNFKNKLLGITYNNLGCFFKQ